MNKLKKVDVICDRVLLILWSATNWGGGRIGGKMYVKG